jgi:hypothetical protein
MGIAVPTVYMHFDAKIGRNAGPFDHAREGWRLATD